MTVEYHNPEFDRIAADARAERAAAEARQQACRHPAGEIALNAEGLANCGECGKVWDFDNPEWLERTAQAWRNNAEKCGQVLKARNSLAG